MSHVLGFLPREKAPFLAWVAYQPAMHDAGSGARLRVRRIACRRTAKSAGPARSKERGCAIRPRVPGAVRQSASRVMAIPRISRRWRLHHPCASEAAAAGPAPQPRRSGQIGQEQGRCGTKGRLPGTPPKSTIPHGENCSCDALPGVCCPLSNVRQRALFMCGAALSIWVFHYSILLYSAARAGPVPLPLHGTVHVKGRMPRLEIGRARI